MGGVSAARPAWADRAGLALVLLAIVAALARIAGSRFVEAANDIRRRLDLEEGLGRRVDPIVAIDLVDDAPGWIRRRAMVGDEEPYFESSAPPSARRLVENVRESSWWTKRLAGDMVWFAAALTVSFGIVVVLMLMAALQGTMDAATAKSLAPWMQAAIVFLVAQGPVQAWRGYASLRGGAGKAQDRAGELLKGQPTEAEAVELAADYHLIRRTAPVIPTLWYNWRRADLNTRWAAAMRQAA
jgi:hypothetical protein